MQIDLSHRHLSEFDSSAFTSDDEREILRFIGKLDLSYNNISSLGSVQSLTALAVLEISHNKVTSLHSLPFTLRQLTASFNALESLDGVSLLPRLEVLIVANNRVTSLVGLPPTVRTLDVSCNLLSSLKGVEGCTHLKEVQARHNVIESAEDITALRDLHSLKALTLAGNPVASNRRQLLAVQALLPSSIEAVDFPSSAAVLVPTGHSGHPLISSLKNVAQISAQAAEVSSTAGHNTPSSATDARGSDDGTKVKRVPVHKEFGRGCNKDGLTNTVRAQHTPEEVSNFGCRTAYSSIDVSQDTSDGRVSPLRPHSESNLSVTGFNEQDPMGYVLKHLQSQLRCCQVTCESYQKENDELRRRVQSLESTNVQLSRENTILAKRLEEIQQGRGGGIRQEKGGFTGGRKHGSEHEAASSISSCDRTSDTSIKELKFVGDASTYDRGDDGCQRGGGKDVVAPYAKKVEMRDGARTLARLLMAAVSPAVVEGAPPRRLGAVCNGIVDRNVSGISLCSSTQSPLRQ